MIMADKSKIDWTDATWNPMTGCTKVSPGCDHCYAETLANRFAGSAVAGFPDGFAVTLRQNKVGLPLRWRRPRRIFVTSMGDLFHDQVSDEFIVECFAVMATAHWHTFQLLTKRHARMRSLLGDDEFRQMVCSEVATLAHEGVDIVTGPNPWEHWPLPNVWVGVSVETQQWADIRIPVLLDTPAAVRWLSCEPLLGKVDLDRWICRRDRPDWVVAGGESGASARPVHHEWVQSLRDQCVDANVPFFFKQWGGRAPKARGRELDGRTWNQYPTANDPVPIQPPATSPVVTPEPEG